MLHLLVLKLQSHQDAGGDRLGVVLHLLVLKQVWRSLCRF